MSALVFALQVLPVPGLALVATLVGASIPIGETLRIPCASPCCLSGCCSSQD
jgi:hypothetical protein